jgi:hypothetical protein
MSKGASLRGIRYRPHQSPLGWARHFVARVPAQSADPLLTP